MELDLTAVKTAFAQFSGEVADETGTQREALCAALCGQCARQVASLARGDLSQAAQALWEAPLEELAAAQAFYQLLLTEEAVTPASITAGDLRLAGGSRSEKAAQLVAEKRRGLCLLQHPKGGGRWQRAVTHGSAGWGRCP